MFNFTQFNKLLKRAMPMRPAPQPVRSPFMGGAFGQPVARAPQPTSGVSNYSGPIPQSTVMSDSETAAHNAAFDKMRADAAALPKMTGFFGNVQPVARAPQPTQGPSAFAGMFGNGGFGQPLRPFTSAFGQPIARAQQQPTQSPFFGGFGGGQPIPAQQTPQPPMGLSGLDMFRGFGGGQPIPAQQTPQPTTGLSGLGTLSPEQITQLQNSMGPQTLPTNVDQELAKMSPGGMQQTAQTGPLFQQSPFANNLGYNDTSTQNMMAGPGMGFPAAPVPSGGATGVSPPPTGGLSSVGFS